MEEFEYDVVIYGTGLVNCLVASILTKNKFKVLHIDKHSEYGNNYRTLSFRQLLELKNSVPLSRSLTKVNGPSTADGSATAVNRSISGSSLSSLDSSSSLNLTKRTSTLETGDRQNSLDSSSGPGTLSSLDSISSMNSSVNPETNEETQPETPTSRSESRHLVRNSTRLQSDRQIYYKVDPFGDNQEGVLSSLMKQSNSFNIDLWPRILLNNTTFTDFLVYTNIHKQLQLCTNINTNVLFSYEAYLMTSDARKGANGSVSDASNVSNTASSTDGNGNTVTNRNSVEEGVKKSEGATKVTAGKENNGNGHDTNANTEGVEEQLKDDMSTSSTNDGIEPGGQTKSDTKEEKGKETSGSSTTKNFSETTGLLFELVHDKNSIFRSKYLDLKEKRLLTRFINKSLLDATGVTSSNNKRKGAKEGEDEGLEEEEGEGDEKVDKKGKRKAKRKSKKEEDGTNGTGSGGDSDVAKGGGSDSGSGGGSGTGNSTNANDAIKEGNDATGRTWSEKLSRIGSRRNSFEEDEVISITDTTPPKLYTITTNIDTAPTDEAAIPASLNYEEDLPIKKSRLKIIPDSQRYTSSDSGTVKEEFALTSMEIGASTGKCSCSSACDHTACNCSHHHACHMGCGVCGFDLLGHRLASSANGSNGAQGAHGMTSTLFPRSKDGITKSVASEDDHSNVATPKNKYGDSNDGKRANVTSPSGVRTNVSGSYDSDSSEEEEDVDECIICSESMKSELKNEIGVLDVCSHIFCFKCIKMWSDRANSCPLCKREFAHIRKVNLYNIQDLIEKYYLLTSATANAGTSASAGIGGSGIFGVEVTGSVGPTSSAERRENKYWRERRLRCIRKNKISKLKKIIREMINWYDLIPSLKVKVDRKKLQGEEEDEGCAICGNDDNWPQLLLCDNCDKGYHMYCLDPPLTEVPPNNWYCAQCNMEAGVTIAGETYGLRRGSTGTSGRSGSTRGRRSRRHNSTTTESTRATRRSRSTRASSRSLLDTLLQEQAEELDMMSLEGRSGSGIVSRDSLENIIRDSIISISSTATNPRTSSLNTVATSGRRPRRRGAEAEALEEEVRTNLLSQVYMGLNRSMSNATRRATAALRNSIIGRAKRTRNNSAMERERRKRARISGEIGATMEEASVETGDIPEGILGAISEGILEAAPETNLEGATEAARARIENTQSNIERGSNRVSETMGTTGGSFGERSTSITNSILTRDFNPDIVKSNAARDWRTNRTMTPPSTSIAFEDANTENIKETVKGRLRRFNFKTKNVDQLIKESLESIDNYLAFNTVPAADIDLISQTTSTSTSALNRARLSAPIGNTESAPTGSSTANSIPSVTEDARNAGVADVTGHRNTSIAAAAKSVTSSAVNRVATEATWAPNTREYRRTTSILSDKIYDELVKRDIDRLITERRSINSSISDGTRPNIKSSEGTGATDSSDTATGREKKYTSFIYRYKTITSDYRERPRSQSRRQEPYINGKTVKYLF